MSPRSAEPLGRRNYWPIFAAAERSGMPLGLHQANINGGHPSTGSGWPTYYMQEHYAFMPHLQSVVVSLIFEGVFERFPRLNVVIIEAGYTWAPALGWRMDKCWERMRKEVPHLKRPPSDYLREHIWFTTQPIEEPVDPDHLVEMIRLDRLGPHAVLDRLSALGFRRPALRHQVQDDRPAARHAVPGQRQGVVSPGMISDSLVAPSPRVRGEGM